MPVGGDNLWTQDQVILVDTLKKRLESTGRPLLTVPRSPLDGPVERYRFKDAKGEIGLISPMSRHFCPTCNRLRLTADGKLRPCLFTSPEVDVKTPLRKGAGKQDIQRLIKQAIDRKPKQHFSSTDVAGERSRPMTAIGG
jgi:cyclic pyranopterin phosphate synthase